MQPETELLSRLGLCLTIMVVVVSVCATIIGGIAFWKTEKGGAKTFSLLVQRASAIQMATVVLIILGACSLRMLNLISSEAVVSILSGVAGYVLGGVSRSSAKNDVADENSN